MAVNINHATDTITATSGSLSLPDFSGAAGTSSGNYQEFASNGTWTKPSGITMVYVECIGGGGTAGQSGGSGGNGTTYGDGGGGGSASITANAGAGGNGAVPGGAGGGGGASVNSFNSGAGGDGAGGIVRIWAW